MIPCGFSWHQSQLKELSLLYCSFCSFKDFFKSLDHIRHPAPHILALADAVRAYSCGRTGTSYGGFAMRHEELHGEVLYSELDFVGFSLTPRLNPRKE